MRGAGEAVKPWARLELPQKASDVARTAVFARHLSEKMLKT